MFSKKTLKTIITFILQLDLRSFATSRAGVTCNLHAREAHPTITAPQRPAKNRISVSQEPYSTPKTGLLVATAQRREGLGRSAQDAASKTCAVSFMAESRLCASLGKHGCWIWERAF